MFYYSHHIGDFIKDTSNLDDHQLATYLRLLWIYYTEEKPLTDDVDDLAFAVRSDEKTVRLLLRHFFQNVGNEWHHNRCDREIAEYHGKSEKARNSANARWNNAKAKRPHSERSANEPKNDANQEPITNNQEPLRERASPNGSRLPADWSLPDDWALWAKETRPELNPNDTAQRFADYWHGVAGAKGRKADWLATWRNWVRSEKAPQAQRVQPVSFAQQAADIARTTVPSRIDRDPALVQLEDDFKKAVPMPESVRQALGSLTRKIQTGG